LINQSPDHPITRSPDHAIGRSPDSRAPAAIGRAARLELVFEARRGGTVLAHAYAEPPYRIGRSFAVGDAAYVILVTSGPGVFAGDALRQSVHVGPGARVVLTSQSALQVHPPGHREAPPASVRHEYRVDDDAELHCHWDPIIPFAGASLVQQFGLDIRSSSRLYWSDALMSGRVTRGEVWRFSELAYQLRLEVDGKLALLERYRAAPRDRGITRAWMTGGAHYAATAIVHDARATADRVETLHRHLQEVGGYGWASTSSAAVGAGPHAGGRRGAFARARGVPRGGSEVNFCKPGARLPEVN
jgi:urease accessory protein